MPPLGFGVAALIRIEGAKAVETHRDIGMVGAQRFFANGQRAPEQRLGVRITALHALEQPEFVEARGDVGMVGTERLFADFKDTPGEGLRAPVILTLIQLDGLPPELRGFVQGFVLAPARDGRHNQGRRDEHGQPAP